MGRNGWRKVELDYNLLNTIFSGVSAFSILGLLHFLRSKDKILVEISVGNWKEVDLYMIFSSKKSDTTYNVVQITVSNLGERNFKINGIGIDFKWQLPNQTQVIFHPREICSEIKIPHTLEIGDEISFIFDKQLFLDIDNESGIKNIFIKGRAKKWFASRKNLKEELSKILDI